MDFFLLNPYTAKRKPSIYRPYWDATLYFFDLTSKVVCRRCGLWAPSRMPLYLVSLFIRVSLIFTEKLHFPVLISLCSLFNLQEISRDIRILSLYITFLTFRLLFSIKTRNQNGNAGRRTELAASTLVLKSMKTIDGKFDSCHVTYTNLTQLSFGFGRDGRGIFHCGSAHAQWS